MPPFHGPSEIKENRGEDDTIHSDERKSIALMSKVTSTGKFILIVCIFLSRFFWPNAA